MMFKKWFSIENSYRQKHIDHFLARYPELANEDFVITEKLHGSNFQWYITPNQPVQAGSRNRFIDAGSSFNGVSIQDLMCEHEDLLANLQYVVDMHGWSIRLFGELFGRGIQKGVEYGDKKRLLYFGLMVEDQFMPFSYLVKMVPTKLIVPHIGDVDGLQAALDFDTAFDSHVLNAENNECEGVVIQPFSGVYVDGLGSPFILKKKNEAFKERQKAPKPVVVDSEVERLNAEFVSYITDNRLQSVFSKEGEIEEPKEIGRYIKLVLNDAKVDFLKDFGDDFALLDKKQQKAVLNVGGRIANMLKAYL